MVGPGEGRQCVRSDGVWFELGAAVSVWDDLEQRLRTRLDPLNAIARDVARGDRDLNPDWPSSGGVLRSAAVLAPIVSSPRAGRCCSPSALRIAIASGTDFVSGRARGRERCEHRRCSAAGAEGDRTDRRYVEPIGGAEPYRKNRHRLSHRAHRGVGRARLHADAGPARKWRRCSRHRGVGGGGGGLYWAKPIMSAVKANGAAAKAPIAPCPIKDRFISGARPQA